MTTAKKPAVAVPVNEVPEAEKVTLDQLLLFIKSYFGFGRKTGTMSKEELIDHEFVLRKAKSAIEARAKLVGEVLNAVYAKEFEGLTAEVPTMQIKGTRSPGFMVVKVFQKRLDTELIKTEMGEDWMEAHTKEINFIQLKSLKEAE